MRTVRNTAQIFALLVVGCLSALAQGPVPLTGEIEQKKAKNPMPPPALDAAREYFEVMVQLQDIIHDYADYIGELDPEARAEFADAIKRFAKGMQMGVYSSDCNALVGDIDAYVVELKTLEKQLAVAKVERKSQEAQLVENLRRELTMLSRLVSEDVSRNLQECSAYDAAIAEYLRTELAERLNPTRSIAIEVDRNGDTVYVVRQDNYDSRYETITVPTPSVPPVPGVPPVPSVPSVPPVAVAPTPPRPLAGRDDMIGSNRVLSGSLSYAPNKGPITITVPTGDLLVSRAGDEDISVTVSIEVSAKTRAIEKDFMAATKLDLKQSADGYAVDLAFPKLRDPDTRLLRSIMTVLVPDDSRLICQNSFGDLTVTQFDGTVTAIGDHSNMTFLDIDGRVAATNSIGSIRLERVDGNIETVNSYGIIEIANCDATASVENSYGQVILKNSSGKAVIENSGDIEVSNHDGAVMVNNRNGKVAIARVSGNLIAYNSYQLLSISNIDGNVKLENANAPIVANNISGRFSAANRYGSISVTNVEGTIDVSNEYGRVDLFLADEIPTHSRISTTSDTIAVWMSAGANVLVNAETLDGSISSYFPIEISSHGERKLGIIKLGDGHNRMDLSGTYSSIMLNESR